MIFCNTDESEKKQKKQVHVLLQKQVDGLLLVPASNTSEDVTWIQNQDVAIVVLDRKVPVEVDTVRADSEGGAYNLIRHLLELGHRRIAVLGGPPELSVVIERVKGYSRVLEEAGFDVDESLIFYREFTQTAGYEMAQQALSLTPRPTALFALNNFIAIGAMRGLRDAGLQVPEYMALVGFDDLPQSLIIEPFLTVVAQPAYDMGQRATELLLNRLSDSKTESYQEIVLPTELIVRRSSGKPLSARYP